MDLAKLNLPENPTQVPNKSIVLREIDYEDEY